MKHVLNRTVYVNGDYVKEQDASVSIFDRGFIFGDGVYEVVPVIKNRLVDKKYFLERLDRSLKEVAIPWPCTPEEYIAVMEKLVKENSLQEGIVYSQVTRGAAERDFQFPEQTSPSLVAFTSIMNLLNSPAIEKGICVVTTPDIRWKRRDIKTINLLGQVLAKQDAVTRNGEEGWMVEEGFVTEGVSSSAYIVKNNVVITRPLSNSILPGIRRRTLLEIAEVENISIMERAFTVDEAKEADEAFISNATTMVLAVVSIDGVPIQKGRPGPITKRLRSLYEQRVLKEASE